MSKVHGANLTEDFADLSDLSDGNRPTKLAARYMELYDSEWTDAFENLDKELPDKDVVKCLLETLMVHILYILPLLIKKEHRYSKKK